MPVPLPPDSQVAATCSKGRDHNKIPKQANLVLRGKVERLLPAAGTEQVEQKRT